MTTRLRFGLLCDGSVLSAWQRSVLQDLAAGGDADLAVVVLNRAEGPPSRTGGLERLREPTAMWDIYNNVWVARRSAAVRPVDCSDLWDGVEQMSVTPEPVGRYRTRFPRMDVERLAGLELDFLLRFGFGILTGDILQVAAHGVWSFHHDDEREIRGGPPSFWEVYDGRPTTGVLLQRLTEELDAGVPLLRWILQDRSALLSTQSRPGVVRVDEHAGARGTRRATRPPGHPDARRRHVGRARAARPSERDHGPVRRGGRRPGRSAASSGTP